MYRAHKGHQLIIESICEGKYLHVQTWILRIQHRHKHAPGVQEAGAEDHDGLARALFELCLDGAELAVDDGHHALDLTRGHRPCA